MLSVSLHAAERWLERVHHNHGLYSRHDIETAKRDINGYFYEVCRPMQRAPGWLRHTDKEIIVGSDTRLVITGGSKVVTVLTDELLPWDYRRLAAKMLRTCIEFDVPLECGAPPEDKMTHEHVGCIDLIVHGRTD